MLSVEAYERGERERQLLRLLVRGEHEIAAGMGYDLDEVLAEAEPSSRTRPGESPLHAHRSCPSFSPLSPIFDGRTRPRLCASDSGRSRPCDGLSSFQSRVGWSQSSPDLPYREVIVSPYRFFYRIKEATVWVVAVWHGAQPPEEPACLTESCWA